MATRYATIGLVAMTLSACSGLGATLIPISGQAGGGIGSPVSSSTLTVAWSKTVGPSTRPAVLGNTAFFSSGPRMTAVDINTGAQRWQVDLTDPQFGAPYVGAPAIVNGGVVAAVGVAGASGLFTFSPTDGSHTGSVAFHQIAGDVTDDGTFAANTSGAYGSGTPVFTTLNFTKTWFVSVSNGSSGGVITITSGRAIMTTPNGVSGFDPAAPCVLPPPPFPFTYCMPSWTQSIPGAQQASNAGHGRIAVADHQGTIHVLDGATGTPIFTTNSGSNSFVFITPTAYSGNDVIYAHGSDGFLRAYNAQGCGAPTCAPIWTGNVGSGASDAPTVSGGQVYIATNNGWIVGFSTSGCGSTNCLPISSADSGTQHGEATRPIIRNGIALVRYANELVAFRIG